MFVAQVGMANVVLSCLQFGSLEPMVTGCPENRPCKVLALLELHLASLPQPARPALERQKINSLNRSLSHLKFRQLVDLCPCSQLTHIQEAMSSLRVHIAVQDPSMFEGFFSL